MSTDEKASGAVTVERSGSIEKREVSQVNAQ